LSVVLEFVEFYSDSYEYVLHIMRSSVHLCMLTKLPSFIMSF